MVVVSLTPEELRALIAEAVAEALAKAREEKRTRKRPAPAEVSELDRARAREVARKHGLIVRSKVGR